MVLDHVSWIWTLSIWMSTTAHWARMHLRSKTIISHFCIVILYIFYMLSNCSQCLIHFVLWCSSCARWLPSSSIISSCRLLRGCLWKLCIFTACRQKWETSTTVPWDSTTQLAGEFLLSLQVCAHENANINGFRVGMCTNDVCVCCRPGGGIGSRGIWQPRFLLDLHVW